MAKKGAPGERRNTKTVVSLAPFTVDEALAALLHTPPPPAVKKEPKVSRKPQRIVKKARSRTRR